MKIICIIPARFASSRFPGKPLAKIAGFPMIEWVHKRALSVRDFTEVIVATDDQRIYDVVLSYGGRAVMTATDLPSGTDRVAAVVNNIEADVVVNLQGDEPLVSPKLLSQVCEPFYEENVLMTTAIKRINSLNELEDPNLVRVVIDKNGDALYFSRSIVPFNRDAKNKAEWFNIHEYYYHIGIYTYRKDFLMSLSHMKQTKLERVESLEQLRVLENGYKIRTVLTDYESQSVDTKEDLLKVEKFITDNKLKLDPRDESM
jgi:3-deoxy-manno-octulosonate cytidylyltransferase (CMP-KDO synthetase)